MHSLQILQALAVLWYARLMNRGFKIIFPRKAALIAAILVATFFNQAVAETTAPAWQVETIGFGTKPSFDFDSQDRIHFMGMIEDFGGPISYASADTIDGPWSLETVKTGYFYGPGDLRVDPNDDNIVHLAWHNHDLQNAEHFRIHSSGATFSVPLDTPGNHDGWDNVLSFDREGTLYQASIDPSGFGAENSLTFSVFDGSTWDNQIVPETNGVMYGFNTALDFESDGTPHIAFTRANGWTTIGDVWHAYFEGNEWQLESVTPELTGPNGRFPSLAVDNQDRVHMAWVDLDINNPTFGTVKYGVRESGSWTIENIGELEHIEMGFNGARKLVSLALDDNGVPQIAFGDRRVVQHAQLDATGDWNTTTVVESDIDLYNGMVVMRLDSNDNPAIAFWQPVPDFVGLVRLAALSPSLVGDFDSNGQLDADDLDQLFLAIRNNDTDTTFDVDENGTVDIADGQFWVEQLADTKLGDANLDRRVDAEDLSIWEANHFQLNTGWATADFNGDGNTDVSDFNLWNDHRGSSAAPVPEPATFPVFFAAALALFNLRRQCRDTH